MSPVWDTCRGWGGTAPAPPGHLPVLVAGSRNGWRGSSSPPHSALTENISLLSSASSLTCFIYCLHHLLFPCCFCTDLSPLQLLPLSVCFPLYSCLSPCPSCCVSSSTDSVAAAAPIPVSRGSHPSGRGESPHPPSLRGGYGSCHTPPLLPNDV